MAQYHILMGDIIASRKYKGPELTQTFESLVSSCNSDLASGILSPYTITLGDEFQGIAKSLKSGIQSIFYFEEAILKTGVDFKLRYVLHYGSIETHINREIAYGMRGPGLTKAREMLELNRRNRPRFQFELSDMLLTEQLNRLFRVIDSLNAQWRKKDFSLISDMLENDNNEQVGSKYRKNRSQIWKRRKHLLIEEYKTLKDVVFDMVQYD